MTYYREAVIHTPELLDLLVKVREHTRIARALAQYQSKTPDSNVVHPHDQDCRAPN